MKAAPRRFWTRRGDTTTSCNLRTTCLLRLEISASFAGLSLAPVAIHWDLTVF